MRTAIFYVGPILALLGGTFCLVWCRAPAPALVCGVIGTCVLLAIR